jgi:hypothetical protein
MSESALIRTGNPEAIEEFVVRMPLKAMRALERVAEYRGMSCQAVAREYLGRGIREDEGRMFNETVLRVTERVLAERLGSEEQAHEIVNAVRAEFR